MAPLLLSLWMGGQGGTLAGHPPVPPEHPSADKGFREKKNRGDRISLLFCCLLVAASSLSKFPLRLSPVPPKAQIACTAGDLLAGQGLSLPVPLFPPPHRGMTRPSLQAPSSREQD